MHTLQRSRTSIYLVPGLSLPGIRNAHHKTTNNIYPKILNRLANRVVISRSGHRLFSAATRSTVDGKVAALASTAGGKDPVVVLGGGWAGFQIALNADKDLPLTVVSPNNHFVFTPLLGSTAVGTLEFRCIQEPIRTVLGPKGQFSQAKTRSLDPESKKIFCESVHNDTFKLEYDKLVIAVGVQTNTFGIPSIKEGDDIFFLKQLKHARGIRNNIIDSFEKGAVPTVSEA